MKCFVFNDNARIMLDEGCCEIIEMATEKVTVINSLDDLVMLWRREGSFTMIQ
jgi:hypothetical protein